MIYPCKKCQRSFECAEAISYCPFCGAAYAENTPEAPTATTRIVIGSDSERTVQERYWQMTDMEIRRMIRLLKNELPDPGDVEKQSLDLARWRREHEKCDSATQFERCFRAMLNQIDELLKPNPSQKRPEPISMEMLANRFDELGDRIAEVLGETAKLEHPTLRFEPVVSQPQSAERVGWETLFATIQSVWTRMFSLVREFGVFVMQSALKQLPDRASKEANPAKLSRRIEKLAQREYDPLFGEGCDDFANAFCEGVWALAQAANRQNALCEYDENERAKIDALNSYADDWAHALRSALDRAYQAQQLEMLDAYESVHRICTKMEEEYKSRNREEEE